MVRELSIHQEHELLSRLEAAGLSSTIAQAIVSSKDNTLAKQIVDFANEKIGIQNPVSESGRLLFKLEVDGTKTLEQLIADGKYKYRDFNIKYENYPIKNITKRTVEIELFHFGRILSSEDAIKEMSKKNYRPATTEELFALGAVMPELQRQFSIIALGSIYGPEHDREVFGLGCDVNVRRFFLYVCDRVWSANCRFAAVSKNF